jgi:hypothetical protein
MFFETINCAFDGNNHPDKVKTYSLVSCFRNRFLKLPWNWKLTVMKIFLYWKILGLVFFSNLPLKQNKLFSITYLILSNSSYAACTYSWETAQNRTQLTLKVQFTTKFDIKLARIMFQNSVLQTLIFIMNKTKAFLYSNS